MTRWQTNGICAAQRYYAGQVRSCAVAAKHRGYPTEIMAF